MKKFISAALVVVLCLFLAAEANYLEDKIDHENSIMIKKETEILEQNSKYMSELRTSIQSDVYSEMDAYLSGYLTEMDLSQYFTEEIIKNIASRVAEEADDLLLQSCVQADGMGQFKKKETGQSEKEAGFTDEEKIQISSMVTEAVHGIPGGIYYAKAEVSLSEMEKAALAEEITGYVMERLDQIVVKNEMSETEIDMIRSEIESVVWEDLKAEIANILLNDKDTSLSINYVLSEEDQAGILNKLSQSINLSGLITLDDLGSEAFSDMVSKLVLSAMNGFLQTGTIGQECVLQKGIDYFTPEEIEELSGAILEALKENYRIVLCDLEYGIEKLNTRQAGMETALWELEEELSEKSMLLADLIVSSADADSEMSESFDRINSEIIMIRGDIDTIKGAMEELDAADITVEQFNSKIAVVEELIGGLQEADAALQETDMALQEADIYFKESIDVLAANCKNALTTKLDTDIFTAYQKESAERTETLSNDLAALQSVAGQNTSALSELQKQIDSVVSQNASDFSELQKQIDGVVSQNASAFSGLQSQMDSVNNDLITHVHDDRYYTESEINTKLDTKNNVTFQLKSGVVSLSEGIGYYRHDELSENQFIIPLSAYMEGDATKTCDIQVQAKIHFRFFTPSSNDVIRNADYAFEYLLVTVS